MAAPPRRPSALVLPPSPQQQHHLHPGAYDGSGYAATSPGLVCGMAPPHSPFGPPPPHMNMGPGGYQQHAGLLSAGAAPFQPGGGGGGGGGGPAQGLAAPGPSSASPQRSPSFGPADGRPRIGAPAFIPQHMLQPGAPSLLPPGSQRQPPPRLTGLGNAGNNLNPGATPFSFGATMPSPGGTSPGAAMPPVSPGGFTPGHMPSPSLSAARGGRRNKPPLLPHTPFKTTGHNSTPSISMSPAAFAAGLAAGVPGAAGAAAKPKRKNTVVRLPREGGQDADADAEEARVEAELKADETVAEEENDEERQAKQDKAKAKAREAARIRSVWRPRQPLSDVAAAAAAGAEPLPDSLRLSEEDLTSCEEYPEPWPYAAGLPESIDIYLPGKGAWDEYLEIREEERMYEREAELERQARAAANGGAGGGDDDDDGDEMMGSGDDEEGTFGGAHEEEHARTFSISSPADPTVVSTRLNSYIESQKQQAEQGTFSPPTASSGFSDALPQRLREAALARLAKRSGSRPSDGHGHGQTMSLSMPSSGGPFASGVLSALGLRNADGDRGAQSDIDEHEPALGERPAVLRSSTGSNADSPASVDKAKTLVDLGRGFGYDIEEVDEEGEAGDDDVRTNPSEDADDDEDEDDFDDDDDSLVSDSESPSEGEFSNPSDEEAARQARAERRALRAEMRAARAIQRGRERALARRQQGGDRGGDEHDDADGDEDELHRRARAGTVDTLPSSGIGEQDQHQPHSANRPWSFAHRANAGADIISNPSDEEDAEEERHRSTYRASGPLDDPIGGSFGGASQTAANTTTIGRSFGGLNPGAKEFKFGAPAHAAVAPAAADVNHFRLPSINRSSFGGSAFNGHEGGGAGHSRSGSRGLNAAAPVFKPGAFTFSAPSGAPAMPQIHVGSALDDGQVTRDQQGREKRQRQRAAANNDDDGETDAAEHRRLASPPRPAPSAASIEGPMRALGLPPFDVNGQRQPPQQPSAQPPTASRFTFKPTAPAFTPTWGRTSGVGASLRRPGLPSFGDDGEDQSSTAVAAASAAAATPAIPTSDFTFAAPSKAVPIRAPEPEHSAAADDAAAGIPSASSSQFASRRQSANAAPAVSAWPDPRLAQLSAYGSSPSMAIPIGNRSRPHRRSDSASSLAMSMDRRRQRRLSDDDGRSRSDSAASDDDDGTVSDIIEELGERMDRALEGWAGKILDEVTIMGQVRPAHAPLDAADRKALLDSISARFEETLSSYFERLKDMSVGGAARRGAIEAGDSDTAADDSSATIKASTPSSERAVTGHPPLDAQGELDFDFVQDVLDQKIANLHRDLTAAFDSSLPRAVERALAPTLAAKGEPVELSTASSANVASLLTTRIQGSLAASEEARAAKTAEAIQAAVAAALGDGEAPLKSFQDATAAQLAALDKTLHDVREAVGEDLQVTLVKTILPHLETLRAEPTDPDIIAARVTEILAPMIEERRQRHQAERREDDERAKTAAAAAAAAAATTPTLSAESVATATLQLLQPLISQLKSEPVDTDAIVSRVGDVVGKQSIDHMVDLEPIVALLEPIVSKQDEVRTLTRQVVERQGEIESTVGFLPSAINAKTEIFLSATQQTHDKQAAILDKLEQLSTAFQAASNRAAELEEGRDDLLRQLDDARREATQRKAEADGANNELSHARDQSSTLKEELGRLASRLDRAERDAAEVAEQITLARSAEEEAQERTRDAQRLVDEAHGEARDAKAAGEGAIGQNILLKAHIEELRAELAAVRVDREQEREKAAQATAEALARSERFEAALQAAEASLLSRTDELKSFERQLQDQVRVAAERAAKAEGEAAALEKRVGEQDNKIANLQQLTATQKQKAAQSQQKLAEGEKRLREHEAAARDLAVANARLAEMESRVAERDEVEARLRASQESEARLRDEINAYQNRFLDVEKDLLALKETLVGRDELEAAQADLASARQDIARLTGQLEERNQAAAAAAAAAVAAAAAQSHGGGPPIKSYTTWDDFPSNSTSTWASVHAPASQDLNHSSSRYVSNPQQQGIGHDESFESIRHADVSATSSRAVEQGEDGWWS